MNNSRMAIIIATHDGTILEVNDAASELFGYSEEEFKKNGCRAIIDGRKKMNERKFVQKGGIMDTWEELITNKKNGEKYLLEFSSSVLHDDNGTELSCIMVNDVSERKRFEHDISLLVSNTEESFILLDKNLRILSFNKQFQKLYKNYFNLNVKTGDDILDYAQPERREKVKEIYKSVLAGNTEKAEIEIPVADGSIKYFSIKYSPAKETNDDFIGVVVTARDITEDIVNINAIKNAREKLDNIMQSSLDVICAVDAEGFFVQMSAAAKTVWGYLPEEMIGKKFIEFVYPEDREKTLHTVVDIMEGNNKTSYENRYVRKDGSVVTMQWAARWDAKTKTRYAVARDVTEKNLYENKMTKAIIKTQEDERNEIGRELHDNVCQILAASKINLGMLKDSLLPEGIQWYDQCEEYIVMALDEIRNISHRLAPAFFDGSTLEEAFGRLINSFNIDKRYKTSLYFDMAVKTISMTPELQLNLYRILQEQLKNIFKYADATLIEVNVTTQNNKLTMKVSDNGKGFNVSTVKNGIGLANMRRRAELFSGKFEILSSVGHGCIIVINIPLEDKIYLYNNEHSDKEVKVS